MKFCIKILSLILLLGGAVYAQTASILPPAKTTFFDKNGHPLTSGKVFFYIPGTTTPKTTWQDAAETIPNTNPVILDAAGTALILGSGNYQQVVFDRNNNQIWNQVTSSTGSGGTTPIITIGDGDAVATVKNWAGLIAPSNYMFTYGQEVSRITYATLYSAITSSQTVFCSNGSPILTGLTDTTNFPIGAPVEVSCLGAGSSTIISKTSTTVTLAANANVGLNTTAIFYPWGNGNATTTFNLPDFRGYVLAGNCNMGGSSCSNLTTTYFGSTNPNSIGAAGGNQSVTLTQADLPNVALNFVGTSDNISVVSSPSNILQGTAVTGTVAGGGSPPLIGGTAGTLSAAVTSTGTVTPTGTVPSLNGGVTQTPFSLVQPTKTTNIIIKVNPDTFSTGYAAINGTPPISVVTANSTATISLNNSGITAGAYGDASNIPSITFNAQGLASLASTNAVVAPAGTLSGTTLNSSVVSSSLTGVGALTSGSIGSGFTAIPNSALSNSATTVNGTTCSLGGTCTVTANFNVLASSLLATATVLPANTYNNGTAGVGATLTGNSNGALSVDSTATSSANIILVKNESAPANNGIYTVTQVGTGSTPYILTRVNYFNTSSNMTTNSYTFITGGSSNISTGWALQTTVATVGTSAVNFNQYLSAPNTVWLLSGLNAYYTAGNVGIGNTSAAYPLDIWTNSPASQLHISGTRADSGVYLEAFDANSGVLYFGASFNGTQDIAKSTTAAKISSTAGGIYFANGTGVNTGSSFVATTVAEFGPGNIIQFPGFTSCTLTTDGSGNLVCGSSSGGPQTINVACQTYQATGSPSDCTSAINAAHKTLQIAQGGIIQLPCGRIRVDGPVVISAGGISLKACGYEDYVGQQGLSSGDFLSSNGVHGTTLYQTNVSAISNPSGNGVPQIELQCSSAVFTGSITGTTLTSGTVTNGSIAIGQTITSGAADGTIITGGSAPTWTINISQSVISTSMVATTSPNHAQISDMAFMQQQPAETGGWAPTVYAPTIDFVGCNNVTPVSLAGGGVGIGGGGKLSRLLFINNYSWIQVGSVNSSSSGCTTAGNACPFYAGKIELEDIKGSVFGGKAINIAASDDVVTFRHIAVWPFYNANTAATPNINTYIQANSTCIESSRNDNPVWDNIQCLGVNKGVVFDNQGVGVTSLLQASNVGFDNVNIGIDVVNPGVTAYISNMYHQSPCGSSCASTPGTYAVKFESTSNTSSIINIINLHASNYYDLGIVVGNNGTLNLTDVDANSWNQSATAAPGNGFIFVTSGGVVNAIGSFVSTGSSAGGPMFDQNSGCCALVNDLMGQWVGFTPTVACPLGVTPPTISLSPGTTVSGRYHTIGKTTTISYDFLLSAPGSCSSVQIGLPNTPNYSSLLSGRDVSVGFQWSSTIIGGTANGTLSRYDNNPTGYSGGDRFILGGVYENR